MTWVLALQVAEYSYEIEQSAYPSREAAMDNLVALVAEQESGQGWGSIGGPSFDYTEPEDVTHENVEDVALDRGVEWSLIEVGT
jgi:hypothetical protein